MLYLKEIRKAKGISQQRLADMLNVARSTVAMWERGTTPDVETLPKIAECLGVTVSALFGERVDQAAGAPREDEDIWELREELRRDPELRVLFSAARNASTEHVRAAAAMLKALKGKDFPDDD